MSVPDELLELAAAVPDDAPDPDVLPLDPDEVPEFDPEEPELVAFVVPELDP
jgi:hypothetical protein